MTTNIGLKMIKKYSIYAIGAITLPEITPFVILAAIFWMVTSIKVKKS